MPIRPLSPELAEKAHRELNEEPARVAADIQHLKDWIHKQPHLTARTDDQWLMAFLRGSKFSLERAKEKLDLYYSVKTASPDLYRIKYSDSAFMDILETGSILILPKVSGPAAPRVLIIRPGAFDSSKYHICDIMSVFYCLQQLCLMEDDHSIVAGLEIILDLENVDLGHFMQMTPIVIKKIVISTQDAAPIRLKGIHCLNTPPGVETIFNAMRRLLNEKNRNRLFVHNRNYEAMHRVIPKEILPVEYGSNEGTIEDIKEIMKNNVQKYSSFLQENEKYGADESKRLSKTASEAGRGSFRRLSFD